MTVDDLYRTVMAVDPPASETAFDVATRNHLFGEIWNRPGLSLRDRRLVTIACVAGADAPKPIADHVYAALASGDLTHHELEEVTLHFPVYCGWPKASALEWSLLVQWDRLHKERGEEMPTTPERPNAELGVEDLDERIRIGQAEFEVVNLISAPPPTTPYFHAGILNFVFGHVWKRPGLNRRDRRLVTIACVGLSDAQTPIDSHVGSALGSGDITWDEMQEIILHFSAYYGVAKGEALHAAAQRWRANNP
jgi:4-carboxymuconolactone decarboxylase